MKRKRGKEMLEYEIEIGKEERDALLEITLQSDVYRKRRKVVTIISVIMCVICLPFGMLVFMFGMPEMASLFMIFFAFFLYFACGGKKVQQKARLKRFYANAQKALVSGHRKYIFSEESISIKSEVAEGVNLWTAYKDWGVYENYIYIRNLSNQLILVRQNELSSEDHAWLVDLLTRHLGAALA